MASKMKCKIVSFEDVHEKIRDVAEQVKASKYEVTTIVGLARGGWIPARLMCDFLGITDLVSLKVEHWLETGKTKDEATIKYPMRSSMRGKKLLVVDDITDTGKSLITAKAHLEKLDPEEIRIGVMQYITSSECKPEYYAEEVTDWYWFIYPWNWIEDTSTLTVRLMSDEEEREWSLHSINSGLQEAFGITWNDTMLGYIMQIMDERGQVDAVRRGGGLRYRLKRKAVIHL
jgi:hypoxanthine phosphoribosyltransferase